MAGLLKVWITITTLILLASCVPQTKQTECKSNQAFSASLRSCIPISQEPTSFVDISSFLPTSPLTKHKSDSNPITFSVTIDNPFAQTYTVEWERFYNGVSYPLSPSTATSVILTPIMFFSDLGTHEIVVKVKSVSGAVIDSHRFVLTIQENPRPVIVSTSLNPALYASSYTPNDLPFDVDFTVSNNNATIAGAGYNVDWIVYRFGVPVHAEQDFFTVTSATGFNFPHLNFDPINWDGVELGQYVVRARITNTALEIVAEQQWSITVDHPDLPNIIARDLDAAGPTPAFSTLTKAFDGTAHNASTLYNFIPCTMSGGICVPITGATQADFCVQVANGEGAYTGDAQFVRVDFYLDGGTNVYSGYTSAADNKVCLTDGGPAVLGSVLFNNTTPTLVQSHTIVARVTDEATGREYTSSDMNPSLGTYPLTWNLTVQPQNQAPTVAFGALTGFSCTSTLGTSKTGCTVVSDTDFTVTINMTRDDFYTLPANEANFNYSIRLYENGVNVQTCTKADADINGATDIAGADGYSCTFRVESFNGSGPLNTMTRTYQVQAEILDIGSPIAGTPATSSTLYWNFGIGSVSEKNDSLTDSPAIANWSVSDVTEGSAISFSADISDPHLDNHTYDIQYCKNAVCASTTDFVTVKSGTITRTDTTNPYPLITTYNVQEDFLLGITDLNCHLVVDGDYCDIQFRIVVKDVPYTAAQLTTTSGLFTAKVYNRNPRPSLTISNLNPDPNAWAGAYAFVGMPITFNASHPDFVDDLSIPGVEKTFRYQWYAKYNNGGLGTYEAIDNATTSNLVWTPSLMELSAFNPISIMVCVEDYSSGIVLVPNPTDSACTDDGVTYNSPWIVTVNNNVIRAHDLTDATDGMSITSSDVGKEIAVWYEHPTTFNSVTSSAAYIASVGNDKNIYVKKVLVRDNGVMDTGNANLVAVFKALPGVAVVSDVRNLSMTGVQDPIGSTATQLYLGYMASQTGSPGSFYPQVRRIDLTFSGAKIAPNIHQGMFGFDYDGADATLSCSPNPTDCSLSYDAQGGLESLIFSPTATQTGFIDIDTPKGTFTVNFGTYDGIDTLCDNCSGAVQASQLATIINTSTDPVLAGYSATDAGGGTVLINGSFANDYFDASQAGLSSRMADQVGKIYINSANGTWNLPFINTTLGGAHNDKISIYSGAIDQRIGLTAAVAEPGTGDLALMDSAVRFDSHYDGTNLWIGLVTKSGSQAKLFKFDASALTQTTSASIMSSHVALDIQVAAGTGQVFAGVRISSGNGLRLGAYDTNLLTEFEYAIDDSTNLATAPTAAILTSADIADYKIVAYGNEARIVASVIFDSVSAAWDSQIYMARLKEATPGVWTLSCGDCAQVSEQNQAVSGRTKVAVSSVRMVQALNEGAYLLGSEGALSEEGIKDAVFIGYGRIDSVAADHADPMLGVLNVEGEYIGSTVTHGALTPEDTGLFRPPLVKNE